MPKVYGIHHTQLDSLSVAPYNVRTLFGINGGPLEMASDFFSQSLVLAQNCLKMDTGRKWRSWLKLSKFDVYQLSQRHTPPDSAQSHSDNPETTPRHLPDSLQTPQNMAHFDQFESTWTRGSIHQFQFSYVVAMLLNIFSEQHLIYFIDCIFCDLESIEKPLFVCMYLLPFILPVL